jgi:hypothetical protein
MNDQKPTRDDTYLYEPITKEEILKIREQLREFRDERSRLASETFAGHTHELRQSAISYGKEYGLTFVRTAFLLNGGAMIALLTFIGSLFNKGDHSVILVAISFSKAIYPAFIAYMVLLQS